MRTAAGLPLALALGLMFGLQGAAGDPHCNRGHPELCATSSSTASSTSTTVPQVTGVTIDASQVPLLRAVTSPAGSVASTFQWQQGDSSGANFLNIVGATASTYTIPAGDTGHSYRVTADGVTSAPYGVTVVGGRLWTGDFNQYQLGRMSTQTIAPWYTVNDLDPTSANPPTIVMDPLGSGEKALAMTVDPTDTFAAGSGLASRTDMVARSTVNMPFVAPGNDTWELYEIMFPSTPVNGAAFVPTPGDWNWLIQWHTYYAIGGTGDQPFQLGVSTGQTPPFTSCGGNYGNNINTHPQMHWLHRAGAVTNNVNNNPTDNHCTLFEAQLDHWYQILLHHKWATDNTGFLAVWIDGIQYGGNNSYPTVNYETTTGQVDQPQLDLGNYRISTLANGATVNWSSTVLYKKARIGLTQASVMP